MRRFYFANQCVTARLMICVHLLFNIFHNTRYPAMGHYLAWVELILNYYDPQSQIDRGITGGTHGSLSLSVFLPFYISRLLFGSSPNHG